MAKLIKSNGNEFEFHNNVVIAGKIIYKAPIKNAHIFTISVRRPGRKLNFTRISVIFEGALGSSYDKMYELGDMVVITGVCQKVRNFDLARDGVKIYGLTMSPKIRGEHEVKDQRIMNVRGRISRTIVISNDILLIYLYTNVHKKFPNPNKESDKEFFEDDYISETPIAIYRNKEGEHDTSIIAKDLTKGTWLDVSGWINTKSRVLKNERKLTEQQLVAKDVFIIGEIQAE